MNTEKNKIIRHSKDLLRLEKNYMLEEDEESLKEDEKSKHIRKFIRKCDRKKPLFSMTSKSSCLFY